MKTGDKIKVHVYDTCNREIKSPITCNGETFTPFETFASSVIFENVETGGLFHFSSIKNAVVGTEIA